MTHSEARELIEKYHKLTGLSRQAKIEAWAGFSKPQRKISFALGYGMSSRRLFDYLQIVGEPELHRWEDDGGLTN